MNIVVDILIMLGLVILSNIIFKAIPAISVPLIQIMLGVIVSVFFDVTILPDYKLFMVLFVAPVPPIF